MLRIITATGNWNSSGISTKGLFMQRQEFELIYKSGGLAVKFRQEDVRVIGKTVVSASLCWIDSRCVLRKIITRS